MVDCIVISDDENSDGSSQTFELASLREEELTNSRPGAISTLANLLENDENNRPDSENRVLLNPTHGRNEDDIFVAHHIGRQLKSHQISGIRFLYSNLVGSVSHFNAGLSGSGCLLAHSMGLGKTLQVVTFLEAVFRATKLERCLIVTPANTIRLWYAEFNKWLPQPPPHLAVTNDDEAGILNLDEDDRFRKFNLFFIDDECKTFEDKLAIIAEWKSGGGVLLLGYEMILSVWKVARRRLAATVRKEPTGGYVHLRHKTDKSEDRLKFTQDRKREYETLSTALFNPGPDIIVCDEGHRLKSESTDIVQLLRKVRTKRRLILTGYPVQNNLLEYWYMVDFIRPGTLGPLIQFKDLFMSPIQRGSAADSVPVEVNQMRQRSHILYSLLKGFVHRRPALLLYQHLPPKYEYILSLKMTSFQCRIYNTAVAKCSMTGGLFTRNLFRGFAMSMKIANHPDVFYRFVQARSQELKEGDDDMEDDDDLEFLDDGSVPNGEARKGRGRPKKNNTTARSSNNVNGGNRAGPSTSNNDQLVHSPEWADWLSVAKRAGYRDEPEEENGGYDMRWAVPLLEGYTPKCNPEDSPKFRVALCLIKHAVLSGDRMLIFSQSLATLDMLEQILQKSIKPHAVLPCQMNGFDLNNPENFWRPNVDYYRFDGSTPGSSREVLVNRFQQGRSAASTRSKANAEMALKSEDGEDKIEDRAGSQAVLFMISTRAGSLGINLTGANRVCLMDASWNPCQDVQALSRVYRFGQFKPCFVYRLVSDCSLERVVYDRQVQKEALSTRVVDDSPANRRFSRDDVKNIFRHYPEDSVVPSTPPADSKELADSLIAAFNAPVVDNVLNAVLRELSFLFSRPPQRHDTFREIDPAQRLSDEERRRAFLQYEVDKAEYENVVLPTFTTNRGGKRKKKMEKGLNDSDLSAAENGRPSKSSNVKPPPPPTPRLTTEGVLSAILSGAPPAHQSISTPSLSAIRAAPMLSSALVSGRPSPHVVPGIGAASRAAPIPPLPPPASLPITPVVENNSWQEDYNVPVPSPNSNTKSFPPPPPASLEVETSYLPPMAPLPLYSLPPAPSSSSIMPSSRLTAPPAFSSILPMPLSSRLAGTSSTPNAGMPLSVFPLPRLPTPPPAMPLPARPVVRHPKPSSEVILISDDEDS